MRYGKSVTLTPALFDAAVAASAGVYGDDPARALALPRVARERRCLAAAAYGLARAMGVDLVRATAPLQLNLNTVRTTRKRGAGCYRDAEAAVIAAVRALTPPAERADDPAPHHIGEAFRRPYPPPATAPGGRLTLLAPRPAPLPLESLDERVEAQLAIAPANSRDLSTILGAKEIAVTQALRGLAAAGRCACDPLPPGGLRAQAWRLIPHPETEF